MLPSRLRDSQTVATLFSTESVARRSQLLSSLVAWDLSLGFSLGCFMTRAAEESYPVLMGRVLPFLFLHVRDSPELSRRA